MIIVDTALKKRQEANDPVRVGLVGAGYIGRGITLQIERYLPGMKVVAIANRTLPAAERAYREVGIQSFRTVESVSQLNEAINQGNYAITDDPQLLCAADDIEAIIEATGHVEFSAHVALNGINNKKHMILMNAELDATVGPILKVYADKAGVIMTNADGDQPGVMLNTYRFAESIGYQPLLVGNIKGLQDFYRTPETQRAFAAAHGLSPEMATSFADGTKISMENAVVANATGLKVGKRGMYGPKCAHVSEAKDLFPMEQLMSGGIVDYILGAEPGPGVFVLGFNDHPDRMNYMKYFKMGEGPLYTFYVPYHLPHLEVPLTVARAVLFHDAAVTPIAGPICDVITVAKRDLKAGDKLDGIGGYTCYGMIDNYNVSRQNNLLPMGLSEECILKSDILKDQSITYSDVEVPPSRLCDKLRKEQDDYFK
jgi:predicted homoserine dehydrogenase-like protein